jgi:rRNA maturation protein Nop10
MCCKPTELVVPPKYSPEDKYAKYRRKVKYE